MHIFSVTVISAAQTDVQRAQKSTTRDGLACLRKPSLHPLQHFVPGHLKNISIGHLLLVLLCSSVVNIYLNIFDDSEEYGHLL